MNKVFTAFAASIVLSGCEGAEYLVLAPLMPIGVAIEVGSLPDLNKQPLLVVNSEGKTLAGPTDSRQEAKKVFHVGKKGVRCSGSVNGSSRAIPVRCSDGQTGEVTIAKHFTIGNTMTLSTGRGDKTMTACDGTFYATGNQSGPFLVKCHTIQEEWADFTKTKIQTTKINKRKGAVSVVSNSSGAKRVIVWIAPSP